LEPDSSPSLRVETASHRFVIQTDVMQTLSDVLCVGLGLQDYELSWDFVDSEAMRDLNRDFRQKDRSTDVLSFPQLELDKPLMFQRPAWPLKARHSSEDGPPLVVGDIVISPDDALKNAENIGHSLDRETCFLLVHGFLHLCGHDHHEPEQEQLMIEQQKLIMDYLEHIAGQPLWSDCIRIEA